MKFHIKLIPKSPEGDFMLNPFRGRGIFDNYAKPLLVSFKRCFLSKLYFIWMTLITYHKFYKKTA